MNRSLAQSPTIAPATFAYLALTILYLRIPDVMEADQDHGASRGPATDPHLTTVRGIRSDHVSKAKRRLEEGHRPHPGASGGFGVRSACERRFGKEERAHEIMCGVCHKARTGA